MWHASFFRALLIVFLLVPHTIGAQVLGPEVRERVPARVLEVVANEEREVAGTDVMVSVQEVRVEITGGERTGEVVTLENELVRLAEGDRIFVDRTISFDGREVVTYADYERRPVLMVVAMVFVVALLLFSRWHGVRALLSLAASIAAIFFLLVPALLAGYDPVLSSMAIAGAILALVFFGTHGVAPRSVIAFVGTFAAVIITGLIAWWSSTAMRLSGFSSDASVYLNFATGGTLDLAGLLLGSIIIGILGVLDDVSITQASVVEQLKRANPALHFFDLYRRASAVGRDHIGSLVNTLALAYVGASLPLILLYANAGSSLGITLNQEVVASELLRIIVGSIGIILAVPATTAVAAWYFRERSVVPARESDHEHHHHHHH